MRSLCSSASKQLPTISLLATILCTVSLAQPAAAQQQSALAASRPLITQPVDESQLTILKGNTHPLARPEFNLGTAPATLPMQRMLLVLKRSPEQESALRQLLDNQQDKSSPSYHKWLTPAEYGQQFGPTDADIQTITAWLESRGFQVGSTKGRTVLEFSGTAGQVQKAFHTTIHLYVVHGEQHWANSSDPSIPTALTPAVAGVATLHNFLKKPQIHMVKEPALARIIPGRKPQVTFPAQNGQPITNAIGPQDYATIYNVNPTYNNGITGQGVTIGVVGRSNLYGGVPGLSPGQDIGDFHLFAFNLPGGLLNIVLNGPDPGDLGGGEESEATLDSTWSGAIAYGATVDLVVSTTTNTTDGVDLSEAYIVENNLADIMTESFSGCQLYATDAQFSFTDGLAEQAAAQGITYFVSAGDNGAEGCDNPASPPATHPISVSLLASTPFNVAVGGTMFNEDGQTSKYWGSEPPLEESALSYIPENVWNESGPALGLWSSSGGASAGNIGNGLGGTTPGIPKPSWQSGVTGIPDDLVRNLPDVSLTAAIHDAYLLCLEGSCYPNSQGELYVYFVGGTSASAPSFASIMALVDQQMAKLNPGLGPRQGQANYVLYRLAASQNADLSQCDASATVTLPASTCIFNDVTVGDNVVPGERGNLYQAGSGYDQTTGLGSVNVTNLVNEWDSVTFTPTTTALALSPVVNIAHGSPVDVTISVSPNSGTGSPSGAVSLLAVSNSTGQTAVDLFTLSSMSTVGSSTSRLPGGGPYSVIAQYAGDGTYAPSDSSPVSVTVTPEPSTTTVSVGNASPFTGGPFGSVVYLRADVAGKSGFGVPTGNVTFLDNGSPIVGGSLTLNSQGNTATPGGILNFDTGTHTISASYSGDPSFNPSNSAQSQSFTITPGFFAMVPLYAVNPLAISAPGSSGQTAVNVTSSTGFSGTITLSCSHLPAGAACHFAQPSIASTGTLTTTTDRITVTTMASSALLRSPEHPYLAQWLGAGSFMFLSLTLIAAPRRRSPLPLLIALLTIIMLFPACGGGGGESSNTGPPPNSATPTGTYNVMVTASSGSTSSITGFTLVVH
jgi:subtilase family serine protease